MSTGEEDSKKEQKMKKNKRKDEDRDSEGTVAWQGVTGRGVAGTQECARSLSLRRQRGRACR